MVGPHFSAVFLRSCGNQQHVSGKAPVGLSVIHIPPGLWSQGDGAGEEQHSFPFGLLMVALETLSVENYLQQRWNLLLSSIKTMLE